jgi:hypothetical protein
MTIRILYQFATAKQRTELGQAEVERRKRLRGIRDFDDLLVLLRDTLAHPEHGPAACRRIRERYRVVLVDEFQDTDPVQWEVLRLAFHGSATLILVGDPKQAIYAFRGAEVLAYLDAVRVADHRLELDVNWRSDQGLIDAYDALFGGARLGHEGIVYRRVRALVLPTIGILLADSILGTLLLGYLYFKLVGESYALVTMGLVSFCAGAQFAPPILFGYRLVASGHLSGPQGTDGPQIRECPRYGFRRAGINPLDICVRLVRRGQAGVQESWCGEITGILGLPVNLLRRINSGERLTNECACCGCHRPS